MSPVHACRPGCGACCIAPSISSLNKPAGKACVHLNADMLCGIFGRPERPACCSGLQPSTEMCGDSREYALIWLGKLEKLTAPT
ncbi:MAG: YkgJ family cysteine cluster protein [Rhodocyclaceae bacterium]|nr:YkgJ family cysteine cluster protein [Rhodocyclaceae bacterium]